MDPPLRPRRDSGPVGPPIHTLPIRACSIVRHSILHDLEEGLPMNGKSASICPAAIALLLEVVLVPSRSSEDQRSCTGRRKTEPLTLKMMTAGWERSTHDAYGQYGMIPADAQEAKASMNLPRRSSNAWRWSVDRDCCHLRSCRFMIIPCPMAAT